jgi:hypothetical protein
MKNYKWKACPSDFIVNGFAEKDLTSDQFVGIKVAVLPVGVIS